MKKLAKGLLIALSAVMAFSVIGCDRGKDSVEVDASKSQLYVYSYNGGVGTKWLDNTIARFESEYAETSFEEGKKGVQVIVAKGKDELKAIASTNYNVIFSEQVIYNDLISQGLLLDISDIVTESLSEITGGQETATIESKLTASQKGAFTATNGKYYMLPHYETYTGIAYNIQVFDENRLYFAEDGGFTDLEGERTVGPDGERGTYDDGLPSSYEEFYLLMEEMLYASPKITPFIWSGAMTSYTNDLLAGLWAAYAGRDEFMLNVDFDSSKSGAQADILSFDGGGKPVVTPTTITEETGYLMSHQAEKYYALSFLENVLSNPDNRYSKITETLTNAGAQEEFVFGSLENKPIAMLIEGNYWYNEASDDSLFKRAETNHPSEAAKQQYGWMPLPRQLTGSVTEGNGTKNTLLDTLTSFAFINANIKNDAVKVKLAKLFLQYCYTNESLVSFTMDTGCFKGVSYTIPQDKKNLMNSYYQNVCEIREKSDIVYPYSDSGVFLKNQTKFRFDLGSSIWSSKVGSIPYTYFYTAYEKDKVTARQFFEGAFISETDWSAYL